MSNRRVFHPLPFVPEPARKEENPDTRIEQLTAPLHHKDTRPEVVKPYQNIMVPSYNKMYGTLRVEDGWQHTIDNYAKGGITTVAGSQVAANVTLAQTAQETRLSRWPGAIQFYLCIRSFSIVASTASFATAGSLDLYYQDLIGGQIIPLGNCGNNDELNSLGMNIIIPTPVTDAGSLANPIGQVQATLSAGATVGTYIWQMAFSYAYLLPTMKPYEIQQVEDLLDAHPGHARHGR